MAAKRSKNLTLINLIFLLFMYNIGTIIYPPTYCGIIGALIGFVLFLVSLEARDMGNIIIRNGIFSPKNIVTYLKSPFRQYFLWHPYLWKSNWIIMSIMGYLIGQLI